MDNICLVVDAVRDGFVFVVASRLFGACNRRKRADDAVYWARFIRAYAVMPVMAKATTVPAVRFCLDLFQAKSGLYVGGDVSLLVIAFSCRDINDARSSSFPASRWFNLSLAEQSSSYFIEFLDSSREIARCRCYVLKLPAVSWCSDFFDCVECHLW